MHPPIPPRVGEGRLGDRPKGEKSQGPTALVNPPHGSPGPQVEYGTQRYDQLTLNASENGEKGEWESLGSEYGGNSSSGSSGGGLAEPPLMIRDRPGGGYSASTYA